MIFCSDSSFKFSLSPVTSLQVNERHEKRSSFIVEKLDNLMKGWKDPTRVGLWTAEGSKESWHFKLIINKRRRKDILIKSPNSGSFTHQLSWAPWIWLPHVLCTRTGLKCRIEIIFKRFRQPEDHSFISCNSFAYMLSRKYKKQKDNNYSPAQTLQMFRFVRDILIRLWGREHLTNRKD